LNNALDDGVILQKILAKAFARFVALQGVGHGEDS
jgi:hypothetical protein